LVCDSLLPVELRVTTRRLSPPHSEGHEVVALDQDLEPDPVAVERPGDIQVGREEHRVDRVAG
jgi:hypothetical protein